MELAVFGGSFDPVHNGHVAVADVVQSQLKPDLLLWVPAGQAPHKLEVQPIPGEIRCELVARLIADRPGEQVYYGEVERPGPSYTVETLEQLKLDYPAANLHLVLGGDSQEHLPSWRRLERIKELTSFVFVPRRDWEQVSWDGGGRLLSMELCDVDATSLRMRLQAGEDCAEYLPAVVSREIRQRGLYQS